jgi:hypothetical protein
MCIRQSDPIGIGWPPPGRSQRLRPTVNYFFIEDYGQHGDKSARNKSGSMKHGVMDNLATHKAAALYDAFPPEEAKRIWDRFEFIYTPKHGSWLNMAEIELNTRCAIKQPVHV